MLYFQEAHDRTDKLQCPKCLRIFALYSDKGYSSSMAVSYIQHLQTHVSKEAKCKKCVLKFHTEVMVRSHVDKDHMSYKNFDILESCQLGDSVNEDIISIPKPGPATNTFFLCLPFVIDH